MRLRARRIEAERRCREHRWPAVVGVVADAFDGMLKEAINRVRRSMEHDLDEGRKYSLVQLLPILEEIQDDGRHVARQILAAGDAVRQAGMLPARSVIQLSDDFTVQDVPRLFGPTPGKVIKPAGKLAHLHRRVGRGPRRLPGCEFRRPFRITPRFDADATEADAVGPEDRVPIPRRPVLRQGNPELAKICGNDAALCLNSSPSSLNAIVGIFDFLKKSTRTNGISPIIVDTQKNAYEISIQQVLVVEVALKG